MSTLTEKDFRDLAADDLTPTPLPLYRWPDGKGRTVRFDDDRRRPIKPWLAPPERYLSWPDPDEDPHALLDEMARMGYVRWINQCNRYVGTGDLTKRTHPYATDSYRVRNGRTEPLACFNRNKNVHHPHQTLTPRCNDSPCKHVPKVAGRPRVWWEDILLDERAGAVQPIVAQALEYIPAVVYELQRHSRVPNEWGRLWPSEQISLRWRQLKADDDTDGQTSKGLGTREPWAWLEYELRAVVVAYYGNKPARIARLAKPGPDGRPFEGPALTVMAVNAALSVKRPSKPEEHQEMPSRLPDGEVAWAKKDGQWGPQPQLVAPPLIVPRWEDFSVTQEYLAELEVPERDRETLLVWMSACKSAPDGKVDWDILATAFGVGSVIAAQNKVRRARQRLRDRADAVLPPDHPARVELAALGWSKKGKRPKVPTVKDILATHGVDLAGKPNRSGWVTVTCPWHETDRKRGGAGWHPALDLFKCWHEDCIMPGGQQVTAAEMLGILGQEAA